MATGTTLTISTRADLGMGASVVSSDAGTPALGSPTFLFDDDETQGDLLKALEDAKHWVIQNVAKMI
jgi:hypothetical protein